jgi:hypothetical protein
MTVLTFKVLEEVFDLLTIVPFLCTYITITGKFWILVCDPLDDVRPRTGVVSPYHCIAI